MIVMVRIQNDIDYKAERDEHINCVQILGEYGLLKYIIVVYLLTEM